jgi:predicted GNAT family acetyltransferase
MRLGDVGLDEESFAPCPSIHVPVGCTLGPLVAADSYLVNDTWEYGKTEATRVQRVLPCIEHQLSMGLRLEETGELVAWAIGDHPYGAIGKVFTVEAHRRKGYSAVVCAALTKLVQLDALGERPRCAAPFCFIVADNEPSLSLFKNRLGYTEAEPFNNVDWVGF